SQRAPVRSALFSFRRRRRLGSSRRRRRSGSDKRFGLSSGKKKNPGGRQSANQVDSYSRPARTPSRLQLAVDERRCSCPHELRRSLQKHSQASGGTSGRRKSAHRAELNRE